MKLITIESICGSKFTIPIRNVLLLTYKKEGRSIAGTLLPEEYLVRYCITDKYNSEGYNIEVNSDNYNKILEEWTEYYDNLEG